MANNLFFSRDTKVFIHAKKASGSSANDMVWDIPVLDGFSFSQATNATEITLNEASNVAAGTSWRGRKMFNDALAPAEWSFSTYMMPFIGASGGAQGAAGAAGPDGSANHHEVSEALWALFFAEDVGTGAVDATGGMTVLQSNANKATIGVFDLYFVLNASGASTAYQYAAASGAQVIYKIANCSVNEASIDFDLDGIATVNWSGFGQVISEESTFTNASGGVMNAKLVYEGVGKTDCYIRNRVSDLVIDAATPSDVTYLTTMTGGNITMSNNLTYLTPETLGVVNTPLGHVTGTKTIGGSFTAYLDANSSSAVTQMTDLFEDLITGTDTVTNSMSLTFGIGAGGAVTAPSCTIVMPTCHLELPTINVEDVISIEANFHALPSDFDSTDEITSITFVGV